MERKCGNCAKWIRNPVLNSGGLCPSREWSGARRRVYEHRSEDHKACRNWEAKRHEKQNS